MHRFSLASFLLLAACGSAVQNRPMEVAYRPPSSTVGAKTPLVATAVEVASDADERTLLVAGAAPVGEIEIVASQDDSRAFAERTARLAARRGATHFHLAATSVENVTGESGVFSTPHEESRTRARFVLYRIDRDVWARLPGSLQPAPVAMP